MPAAAICNSMKSTLRICAIRHCAGSSPDSHARIRPRCRVSGGGQCCNAAISDIPSHYDDHHASVPRQLPLELRGFAAVTSRWRSFQSARQSTCTGYFMEYDNERLAVLRRCASCLRSKSRSSCSASSPVKAALWKRSDDIKARRIDEAAKYVGYLDLLCLSPIAAMRLQLRPIARGAMFWPRMRAMGESLGMIVEIAEEVWGIINSHRSAKADDPGNQTDRTLCPFVRPEPSAFAGLCPALGMTC